jgi:hypothetical protein
MVTRRKPNVSATPTASHLQRSSEWAGLREGDRVDVVDARERGGSWSFGAHVTNVETGAVWVEVVGGKGGEQRRRSIRPDQVFPHRSTRRGSAPLSPLSDAPQLPL